MTDRDRAIYGFLSESAEISLDEYDSLTEEFKENTAKEMSKTILDNIRRKLGGIDVTDIDRSRGEIKNYPELGAIQNALAKLKMISEQDSENMNSEFSGYIETVIDSIKNLSKTAPEFKEAYRSKKTLLMLKYQSVVLAILASVSYLVSVGIDFKDPGNLKLKQNIDLSDVAPLRSLSDFNRSVDNGDFHDFQEGVATLRNFYCEYSPADMMTICEAVNVVDFINNGVSALTQNIRNNGRASAMIYKISSLIILLLSLRSSFYSIAQCKTKVSDYLNQIKAFVNIDNLPSLSALSRFITMNNKVASNEVDATKAADNEIQNEDRRIITVAKDTPSALDAITAFMPKPEVQQISGTKELSSIPEAEPAQQPNEYSPMPASETPVSQSETDQKSEEHVLDEFGF